jgi:phosphoserine aminotransferase
VKVPNGDWIADDREGLAICDATSAVFAMDLPWQKLDVVTWSWQKVMGGEGAHGMLVLSPRAIQRLESYSPPWPMPKIFRMTTGGKVSEAIFKGDTINTPSLLCDRGCNRRVEVGRERRRPERASSRARRRTWACSRRSWPSATGSPSSPTTRTSGQTRRCASTSPRRGSRRCRPTSRRRPRRRWPICWRARRPATTSAPIATLRRGLRIWCGATVEKADLEALLPWLDWAYGEIEREFGKS